MFGFLITERSFLELPTRERHMSYHGLLPGMNTSSYGLLTILYTVTTKHYLRTDILDLLNAKKKKTEAVFKSHRASLQINWTE